MRRISIKMLATIIYSIFLWLSWEAIMCLCSLLTVFFNIVLDTHMITLIWALVMGEIMFIKSEREGKHNVPKDTRE